MKELEKILEDIGQWIFLGCYHTPYKGKMTSEIKDCPKE